MKGSVSTPLGFDVFLSHNSRDKEVVERIARKLKHEAIGPWFDKWCLTPGGDWQDELADGLRRSASCAVFVGPGGIGDWERLEFKVATDRMAKERDFRVFLVLLPGLPDPFDVSSLPPFLCTRTWVDLRKGVVDACAFQRLINAVKGVAPGPETLVGAHGKACPYRGLRPFHEEHAEFFFGRESDVQRLVEKLKSNRFLSVIGPSGSGKSSVVRAGLIATLSKGALPGSDAWPVRVFMPGARPLASLAANVVRLCPQSSPTKTLDELTADERALHLAASVALAERSQSERVVWVIDQFEEVFTLCRDEAERSKFISNLLYAATVPGGRSVVVLTMRADFYQKCAAHPELSSQISAQQFIVSPLSTEGLRQAITEPAWRVDMEFESGLVETILDDVESQPGALPLLEHALLELWERRRGRTLTLEAYRETGGVAGAIAKRADAVFESYDAERQSITRRVMLRLTQPGEGTEDTRRRATLGELVTGLDEAEKVREVVTALADARLLTTDGGSGERSVVVEVSHEALIRGWPRLRAWVEEDRQGLHTHRRLTEAAQDWERSGRDDGLLFSAARLAQIAEWREHNFDALNDLERVFLDASTKLAARERLAAQRRRHRVITALIVALALISAASIYAFIQSRLAARRGDEAFARELAANAMEQLSTNPELSLLLAIEAAKHSQVAETENTLRQVLSRTPTHVIHTSATDSLSNQFATFGRGGKLVVAVNDKTLWAFDAENGRMLFERRHDLFAVNAAVSTDGNLIATTLDPVPVTEDVPEAGPSTVKICEAGTGRDVTELQVSSSDAEPTFSPDDKFLVTSGDQSQVWEVGTWQAVATLDGGQATFSRDGRILLTKSSNSEKKLFVTEVASWRRLAELPVVLEGTGGPLFGALSPDGERVVTSTPDRRIRLHEAKGGRVLRELKLIGADSPSVPQFSPDGRFVAFAVRGKTMLWYTGSGTARVLSEITSPVHELSFSPDGRLLLAVSDSARLHDLHTGRVLAEFRANSSSTVNAARFSPDGMTILTSNTDGTIFVWDLSFRRARMILEAGANQSDSYTVSAAFSPDAKLVATVRVARNQPDVGQVWELATGHIWTFTHDRALYGIAFSTDGEQLLTTDDVSAQVRELSTGRVLLELPHGEDLHDAAFSPDAKQIITTGERVLKIWDVNSGRIIEEIPSGAEDIDGPATFSPDSQRVLIVAGGRARVWDVGSRRVVLELSRRGEDDRIEWAVYSPDGRYILTWNDMRGGAPTRSIQVWEANTGRVVAELNGHVDTIISATFDRASRYALTTSGFAPTEEDEKTPPEAANAARVWDLRNGNAFYDFRDAGGPVLAGAFDPTTKSLMVINESGMVFSYSCELCASQDDLLRLAQKRFVRRLTPDERVRYLHEPPID